MKLDRVFIRTIKLDLLTLHVKPSGLPLRVICLLSVTKTVTFIFKTMFKSLTLLGFYEV